MKFRKKPVVVDAFLYTGRNCAFTLGHWEKGLNPDRPGVFDLTYNGHDESIIIRTLEDGQNGQATHVVDVGDWIIRGVKGEYYAIKPDIFAATYELASEPTDNTIVKRIADYVRELREDDAGHRRVQVFDVLAKYIERDFSVNAVADLRDDAPLYVCERCQMKVPERLATFGVGVRAGHAAWCAACRVPDGPDGAAKRAEVVAMRKSPLSHTGIGLPPSMLTRR